MRRPAFERFNDFIVRRRKLVIVAWCLVLVISATQIPTFFSAISYNITNSGAGGPTNTESQNAQTLLNTEFPRNISSGQNNIVVVLQAGSVYSSAVQAAIIGLNRSIAADPALAKNFTGMDSIYSTEFSLLKATAPSILPQVSELSSSIATIDAGARQLFNTDYLLVKGVQGINQTAQLVYGLPSAFVEAWSDALGPCGGSTACADLAANQSLAAEASGNPQMLQYYNAFFSAWSSSFLKQPSPTSPSPAVREQSTVSEVLESLLNASQLPPQEAQTFELVGSGLNVSNWAESQAIGNLAVRAFQSEVPANLSSSLGIGFNELVARIIELGPSPTNSTVLNFTLGLFAQSPSSVAALSGTSINALSLVTSAYNLGPSPSSTETWDLASRFVANATALSFSTAPLLRANATSLSSYFVALVNQSGSTAIRSESSAVADGSVYDYPLTMTRALSQNFVSQDNKTMIVSFNFASYPDAKEIAAFQSDVASSGIGGQAEYWVTGTSVITQDVSGVFGPAITLTLGPGVVASIIVVALLLLSPLAALIPVIVGGFAIAISLPTIYLGVVDIGHETLGFLTPTLTILLVLGLSVDYSVLQLRRMREERVKGRTKEESVAISLRWAGQAVLTAGITVITAYVIMAVTKVPLFSDVGTGIAIAVSILLAAALTLLPALELTLGDKIFWPSLSRARRTERPSKLLRLGEKTLHHKVTVVVIVAALALGAFYVSQQVVGGADFFRLLPDFPGNHALTVITDNFGSYLTGSTFIVLRLPTPVIQGGALNQTLLNDVEQVTAAAASVTGVVTITGPTRPYGSTFNYSDIDEMAPLAKSQYTTGLLSDVGIDNRTVVINIGLTKDPQSQAAIGILRNIESKVNAVPLPKGTVLYYGGTTQSTLDSQSFLDGIIPQVILTLAAAIYVILLIQLRSAFTPIRLILTILCSVAFSLALLVVVFYYALGLPIFDFAPLFVVVTMLGVGIDYDIFLVTRIREEVLGGATDDEAIKNALSKSWVTILGLGLVLATVFASVVFTGIAFLQQIGLVVAMAVMIDVSTVILFLVPALMGLAQRYNWWPSKMGRREPKSAEPGR